MAAAVALAAVVGGCIGTTSRGRFEEIIQERGGGYTADFAREAVDAVAERLGVDDFEICSIRFSPADELVTLEVRDPQVPQNLDTYTVQGGSVSDQTPVQLSAATDLASETIPVANIAFDRIEEIVDTALAQFDPRNGYVTSMSVTVRSEGEAVFSLAMESDRASAQAEFTGGGDLIEVRRL